jgi:hypothetical protein
MQLLRVLVSLIQIFVAVLRSAMPTTDLLSASMTVVVSNAPVDTIPRKPIFHGTSYAEQGTIQGLQDPGSSQIVQTQTVSSQSFGNVKTLNAADELAAAKAEQATWEEVMSVRERTEDLKRIVQGVDMHSSQQLETLTVLPHQYIDCV